MLTGLSRRALVLYSTLVLITVLAVVFDWRWGRFSLAEILGPALGIAIVMQLVGAGTAKRAEESRRRAREVMDSNWQRQHEDDRANEKP